MGVVIFFTGSPGEVAFRLGDFLALRENVSATKGS